MKNKRLKIIAYTNNIQLRDLFTIVKDLKVDSIVQNHFARSTSNRYFLEITFGKFQKLGLSSYFPCTKFTKLPWKLWFLFKMFSAWVESLFFVKESPSILHLSFWEICLCLPNVNFWTWTTKQFIQRDFFFYLTWLYCFWPGRPKVLMFFIEFFSNFSLFFPKYIEVH